MRYIPLNEQITKLRAENAALRQLLNQTTANLDYIAMMTDVEIEEGETADDNDESAQREV